MKKAVVGFVAAAMIFPAWSLVQAAPKERPPVPQDMQAGMPPGQAEWVELMKKQAEARKAFNDQLNAERDAFLKDHPEFAERFEAGLKAARERAEARRAEMQKNK